MQRNTLFALGALGCVVGQSAYAQSSVSLYGLIDNGIAYVSNVGGKAEYNAVSGVLRADRFGMVGSEDLGGGLSAIFRLESGFSSTTGALMASPAGSSAIFGRAAYVGLRSDFGTLTLGRQMEYMSIMADYSAASYGGDIFFRPFTGKPVFPANGSGPDIDGLSGTRMDNAVKYSFSDFHGLSGGVMYGFGNQAGEFSNGSAMSAGVRYEISAVTLGGAYTDRKETNGDGSYRNYALGALINFGSATANILFTNSRWSLTGDDVDVIETGLRYQISASYYGALTYQYLHPNHGQENELLKGNTNVVGLTFDHTLSKQTEVMISAATHIGQEGYTVAPFFTFGAPNSGARTVTQVVATLLHRF